MRVIIAVVALVWLLAQPQPTTADDAAIFRFKGYWQAMTFEEATAVARRDGETLKVMQDNGDVKGYVTSGTGMLLAFVDNHLAILQAQVAGGIDSFDKLVDGIKRKSGMSVYESNSSIEGDAHKKTARFCKNGAKYYLEVALYEFNDDRTHVAVGYNAYGVPRKCVTAQ
jgi:hypothetical protein